MIAPQNGHAASPGNAKLRVREYYGKYRGVVVNNTDPKGLGRILATVAEISPVPLLNWAAPASPIAGPQSGLFSPPPIGTEVWIEFEQGDPDYPIWAGCTWGGGVEVPRQAPAANPALQSITLQTQGQTAIVLSDAPGSLGIEIKLTAFNQKVTLSPAGIEINNGLGASIKLQGVRIEINALGGVSINGGALEVR